MSFPQPWMWGAPGYSGTMQYHKLMGSVGEDLFVTYNEQRYMVPGIEIFPYTIYLWRAGDPPAYLDYHTLSMDELHNCVYYNGHRAENDSGTVAFATTGLDSGPSDALHVVTVVDDALHVVSRQLTEVEEYFIDHIYVSGDGLQVAIVSDKFVGE